MGPSYKALLVDKNGQHEFKINSLMFGFRDGKSYYNARLTK